MPETQAAAWHGGRRHGAQQRATCLGCNSAHPGNAFKQMAGSIHQPGVESSLA